MITENKVKIRVCFGPKKCIYTIPNKRRPDSDRPSLLNSCYIHPVEAALIISRACIEEGESNQ